MPAQAPALAARVFGDRLPLARRYAEILAGAGVERGLIGPHEGERLWDRHLLNCAVIGGVFADGWRVVDLGSGAGLPGIPLAIARPDLRIVLLEPMERRVTFLNGVVRDLALHNVRVRRGRAEAKVRSRRRADCKRADGRRARPERMGSGSNGDQPVVDVVVCRAVAPLARLVAWAKPITPRGALVALKGSSGVSEVHDAEPVLRALGASRVELLRFPADSTSSGPIVDVLWARDRATRAREVQVPLDGEMLSTAVRVEFHVPVVRGTDGAR